MANWVPDWNDEPELTGLPFCVTVIVPPVGLVHEMVYKGVKFAVSVVLAEPIVSVVVVLLVFATEEPEPDTDQPVKAYPEEGVAVILRTVPCATLEPEATGVLPFITLIEPQLG
jgi:hypothetical protein